MKKINLLYQQDQKQQIPSTHPQLPADFNNFMHFGTGTKNVCTGKRRRSPTSDCPSFEHLDRKHKKPMMEKKRRLRINNCFDKLKEILMHSESQQSKLEKADILEKTIVFVEHLQQKLNQLQQQMNQLLVGTEAGQQFQSGVSIAIAATNDLLAGLQPDLCRRVELEVQERVARAVGVVSNGSSTIPFIPPIQKGNFVRQVNQQFPPNCIQHSKFKTSIFPNNNIQPTSFPYFQFPPFSFATTQQQQRYFINSKCFFPCSAKNSNVANIEEKAQISSDAATTQQQKNEEEENEEEVVDVESLSTNNIIDSKDNQLCFDKNGDDKLKINKRISRKNLWRPY